MVQVFLTSSASLAVYHDFERSRTLLTSPPAPRVTAMGTFFGHLAPGVFILAIGLWHLYNTLSSYSRSPATFRSRVWHPVPWGGGRLWYLEPWLLAVGTAALAFYELLICSDFRPLENGAIPFYLLEDWEHTSMVSTFCLFALAVLLSETTALLPLPPGGQHLLAVAAFCTEWVLFNFHSINHGGLEGQAHLLLTYAVAAVIFGGVATALAPACFLADCVMTLGVALNGTWLIQMAFNLYIDGAVPTGCHHGPDLPDGRDGRTLCDTKDAEHRGMAILNLEFNFHVLCLLVLYVVSYAAIRRACPEEATYTGLNESEADAYSKEDGYGPQQLPGPGLHRVELPRS